MSANATAGFMPWISLVLRQSRQESKHLQMNTDACLYLVHAGGRQHNRTNKHETEVK